MPAKTITLTLREPKKHSVRYDCTPGAADALVQSVYVSKKHLTEPWPQRIEVAIAWGSGQEAAP